MDPTDPDLAEMAGRLFDEVLAPLSQTRRAGGARPYFPVGPDPAVVTYFVSASPRSMTAADFEFPGGGNAHGLVGALIEYWRKNGELPLAAAESRLIAIADALAKAGLKTDASVDIFCYTLF